MEGASASLGPPQSCPSAAPQVARLPVRPGCWHAVEMGMKACRGGPGRAREAGLSAGTKEDPSSQQLPPPRLSSNAPCSQEPPQCPLGKSSRKAGKGEAGLEWRAPGGWSLGCPRHALRGGHCQACVCLSACISQQSGGQSQLDQRGGRRQKLHCPDLGFALTQVGRVELRCSGDRPLLVAGGGLR